MRLLVGLLLAFALVGCGGGPDKEILRRDVEAQLSAALPPGTLEIADLARRGTQRDARAPLGADRRVVYFDLELRLLQDYHFGAWDAQGVAGLVSALGIGPKGVRGVLTGGNRAGDIIRAHGSLIYSREDGDWVLVTPKGVDSGAEAIVGAARLDRELREQLDSLEDAVRAAPPDVHAAVIRELESTGAAVGALAARARHGYAVAAGPEGGQYHRFARALVESEDIPIVALETRGGEENLRLLRSGRVDLALSQADAAIAAYRGQGPFAAEGPNPSLRVIGALYPEPVHVLVPRSSPVAAFAELRGRRIAVGRPGAAARTTALAVLEAHGIGARNAELHELPLARALRELRAGSVDAVITVIGVPADAVRDAMAVAPLRLLSLDADAVAALAAGNEALLPFSLPAGTYAMQRRPTRTLAIPALLLVRADMSDIEVEALTRAVFTRGADLAARGSSQGAQVSAARALVDLPIPRHEAAEKLLRELSADAVAEAREQHR